MGPPLGVSPLPGLMYAAGGHDIFLAYSQD